MVIVVARDGRCTVGEALGRPLRLLWATVSWCLGQHLDITPWNETTGRI